MLFKFLKKIEQFTSESLQRILYSHKVSTLNKFSEVPLWLLKSIWFILWHCKYEISKILDPRIKKQSLLFLRIYIYENCICVFILSAMKICAPAAHHWIYQYNLIQQGSFLKRVHSPARRKNSTDVFLCYYYAFKNISIFLKTSIKGHIVKTKSPSILITLPMGNHS